MQHSEAQRILDSWDRQGRYVYSVKDLSLLLSEKDATLKQTLKRFVESGLLQHVAQGTYLYSYSRHRGPYTIEAIAQSLRRREYNYVSYESALSEYGIISQIPLDRITLATTGRKGEFQTPYGVIEFTHTMRSPLEIIKNTVARPPHLLRIATADFALQNLKDSGRNLNMIDYEAWKDLKSWQEE